MHNISKIISIIGARPQFIKAAPLSLLLRENFDEKIIHTGQHYDFGMSEVFFNELGLAKPAYNLGIGSGSHGVQTGKMLSAIDKILLHESPDLVIVYGDTNTTLAGALSASKMHIPVAHVEAGLRSNNRMMPEELNRIMTDHISDLLFVPSSNARNNLEKENIQNSVFDVGDIMLDSVIMFEKYSHLSNILFKYNLVDKEYYLTTIHRAENVDDPTRLNAIFESFREIDKQVILPIHPRTKKRIKDSGVNISSNVRIIEPISYLAMIELVKKSRMILTDSGGLQKEAYYLGVPCITLRNETEWIETVNAGWNKLTSVNHKNILQAVYDFESKNSLARVELYGDGKTSQKIIGYIKDYFNKELTIEDKNEISISSVC